MDNEVQYFGNLGGNKYGYTTNPSAVLPGTLTGVYDPTNKIGLSGGLAGDFNMTNQDTSMYDMFKSGIGTTGDFLKTYATPLKDLTSVGLGLANYKSQRDLQKLQLEAGKEALAQARAERDRINKVRADTSAHWNS